MVEHKPQWHKGRRQQHGMHGLQGCVTEDHTPLAATADGSSCKEACIPPNPKLALQGSALSEGSTISTASHALCMSLLQPSLCSTWEPAQPASHHSRPCTGSTSLSDAQTLTQSPEESPRWHTPSLQSPPHKLPAEAAALTQGTYPDHP